MKKLGLIKKLEGEVSGNAYLILEDGRYFLKEDCWIDPFKIDLTEHLANVSVDRERKQSTSGVLLRTAIGGLAGASVSKGRNAVAGAMVGLGSAIPDHNEKHYVNFTFTDGTHATGETNAKTASTLKNISPNLSGRALENHLKKARNVDDRLDRFLNDAPRTYYETKSEFESLQARLSVLDDERQNGASFKERDKAEQQYLAIEEQIKEKGELLQELAFRAKAIKKFGDFETFNELQAPLTLKIWKLEDALESQWYVKKWHFWVLAINALIWWAETDDPEGDPDLIAFNLFIFKAFFVYYVGRLVIRLMLTPFRNRKLKSLQKEYKEKYSLEEVELEPVLQIEAKTNSQETAIA